MCGDGGRVVDGVERPLLERVREGLHDASRWPWQLLASSCVTYRETVAIHFSSDPPGADVVVDGVPSGFAPPCMIALEKREQVVTIEKQGYQVPARRLYPAFS